MKLNVSSEAVRPSTPSVIVSAPAVSGASCTVTSVVAGVSAAPSESVNAIATVVVAGLGNEQEKLPVWLPWLPVTVSEPATKVPPVPQLGYPAAAENVSLAPGSLTENANVFVSPSNAVGGADVKLTRGATLATATDWVSTLLEEVPSLTATLTVEVAGPFGKLQVNVPVPADESIDGVPETLPPEPQLGEPAAKLHDDESGSAIENWYVSRSPSLADEGLALQEIAGGAFGHSTVTL